MNIEALPSLFACATRAVVKNADPTAIKLALDDLQEQMFGMREPHKINIEFMLKRAHEIRALLAQGSESGKSNLNTERLLLEAVATLGELLLSAAAGKTLRAKTAKGIEDVLLPILFLRTSVTPSLLKAHALKSAWSAFQSSGFAENEPKEKLWRIFISWHRNHGWDFVRSNSDGLDVSMPTTTTTPHVAADTATSTVGGKTADCSPPTQFTQQRVALRDIQWNTATAQRGATSGIPSYLLTKRRRCDSTHQENFIASVRADEEASNCLPDTAQLSSHIVIDKFRYHNNSNILALESPVKRRRRDFTVDVPPSPDRPG
ncbi:hypothetical protein JKF63_06367 [Porcisia hertigi]|uniref:Uncharacterized protein n=1 Tax=Porcisia hertigi TaxID=2761500 RepID=A0A836LJS8_9TRYP|nr:hypothetical protein JKF63_06367 [Porcisia hertigi]